MSDHERIREALDRAARAYERRPSAARSTGSTSVRLVEGLACEVEQGDWRFVADQPETKGGENRGPDPGFFGRAALGVCAAQGYAYWFARLGLPFRSIEVRVESDIDGRGSLGVDDGVVPGYQGVRCLVTVESDADDSAILEALDLADRHSPWLWNFTQALAVTREVTIAPVP